MIKCPRCGSFMVEAEELSDPFPTDMLYQEKIKYCCENCYKVIYETITYKLVEINRTYKGREENV